MWMEHSLQPKVQGDVAAWFGSLPVVPAACKGNELLTDDRLQDQRLRQLRQDQVLEDAGRQMRHARAKCVPYYRWVSDYIGVIGGR